MPENNDSKSTTARSTTNSNRAAQGTNPSMIWGKALIGLSILGPLILIIIVIGGVSEISPISLWGVFALLMVLLLLGVGIESQGKLFAFLIDPVSKRMSLSRLQISLWTVLILSAFLALALPRSAIRALARPSPEEVKKCVEDYRRDVEGMSDAEWALLNSARAIGSQATVSEENIELATQAGHKIDNIEQRAGEECNDPKPLNIIFPSQIVVALGISAASFAGSSLVKRSMAAKKGEYLIKDLQDEKDLAEKEWTNLNEMGKNWNDAILSARQKISKVEKENLEEMNKADKDRNIKLIEANDAEIELQKGLIEQNLQAQRENSEELRIVTMKYREAERALQKANQFRSGTLYVNDTPHEAGLSDLFLGDTVDNKDYLDLSKVQMFFFTVIIIAGYTLSIYSLIQDSTAVLHPLGVEFPLMSSSMNALFGISHASYVTVKQVNQPEVK